MGPLPIVLLLAVSAAPSPVIHGISWESPETIVRRGLGSDNWPLTWGDDDAQYTAYGDGWGFSSGITRKLSLGLAKIVGGPAYFQAENLPSPSAEQYGDGAKGKKASGILMVDGVLYLLVRNAANAQLAWSKDRGKTWTWCPWRFTEGMGCPTLLNFGPNYRGARDNYVYLYSPDTDTAYRPADQMVLARVPEDRLTEREAYEFFVRLDGAKQPVWTRNVSERGPVFRHPGKCGRSIVCYNAGLRRYLWVQVLPGKDDRRSGGLAIYDAPEPWGPWTTAYYAEPWDLDAGETAGFPTRWISEDGKDLCLVFSGGDSFSVRKAKLSVSE